MKKKKSRFGVILLAIIAIGILSTAIFLMLPGKHFSLSALDFSEKFTQASAPPTFAGPIKAITLSDGAAMLLGEDKSREAQKSSIDSALDFAVQNNFEAILWKIAEDDGTIYYRKYKGDAKPPEFITKCDKFLSKWDPLAYLCSAASKRGLGVFAYAAPQSISAEGAQSLEQSYALSGTYVKAPASELAGGTSYMGVFGEPQLTEIATDTGFAGAAASYESEGFGGFVFGECSDLVYKVNALAPFFALYNEAPTASFTPYVPNAALTLTYPQNTAKALYTDTCYLMGTSDPAKPLTLNGNEVKRYGTSGLFGVLVNLQMGGNSFTLAQGGSEVTFVLTRASSSYKPNPNAEDGTNAVAQGQMVEITTGIASGLTDPSSDDNINETFKKGAKVTVTSCVRTMRGGKKTWAYQLASGDYILARNTKPVTSERAAFTGTTAQKSDIGELIPLGGGTPLCYTQKEGNLLTLTFYDTDIPAGFAINGSDYILGTAITPVEGGVALALTLNPDKPLWGWDIRYSAGNTELFLKAAPKRSEDINKPLQGVRVLLDAGHGEDDFGAIGVAGPNAPVEKDVNLNVTLSAKHYLEKLGATVLLTREDGGFKTLDERLYAISEEAPDFFIAIHHNSVELVVDANESRGVECYYFYKWHKPLAASLVNTVSTAAQREKREAKYGYYYVTRTTVCPSVLLETGFMVNPLEYESITSPKAVAATGAGIAQSILELVPII